MLTSPLVVKVRSVTRKLGINRLIGSFLQRGSYEDKFGQAFRKRIRSGDVVWDVGANVGLYTLRFLSDAGPEGRVVAFEPTAACFQELRARLGQEPRVVLKNIAMGNSDSVMTMIIESDPMAATHRLVVGGSAPAGESVSVEVRSAASVVKEDPSLFPNIVKVDVEGHEGAVLHGLEPLLIDSRLHCVGVEVHFELLERRGEAGLPKKMQAILEGTGFNVRWTDASHLLAVR